MAALVAFFLLNGCPDDEDAEHNGESETGDPGTDPIDPIDGDGSAPTGRPDPDDRWVAPSTLGNGLVHDTRSAVDPSIHAASFTGDELAAGAAWSSFVESNPVMLERGFRPTQDWAPAALGARPTSIQTFAGKDYVGYAVAWVYDSATKIPTVPWVMKVGQTEEELVALLADPGQRPISLSSRRRAGASEYAVILVPSDSPANWSASIQVQASSLAGEIAKKWQDGFYPFRITVEDEYLMASPNLVQGLSQIGQVWPCIPDPSFGPGFTGCELFGTAIY